jgi:hypothetical protein
LFSADSSDKGAGNVRIADTDGVTLPGDAIHISTDVDMASLAQKENQPRTDDDSPFRVASSLAVPKK